MKKVITFLLLLLAAGAVSAQNFSGGLRAGMNCATALDHQLKGHGHMTTFQKEVFVRYQGKSKWAFEVSAGHEQYKNPRLSRGFFTIDNFSGEGLGGPVWQTIGLKRTSYQVSVKAAYEMSCSQSDHCPLMSRFKNYIGIVAGPSFVAQQQKVLMEPESGTPETLHHQNNSVQLWAGLSNTLQFSVTDRLFISGDLNYQVNLSGGNLFSAMPMRQDAGFYDPNNRFTATLGIGYKF